MYRTSNWVFLLSLGALGGCDDDASSVPPCNPDRLGRECNDVDPDPLSGIESGGGGNASESSGEDEDSRGSDSDSDSDSTESESGPAGTSTGGYGTGYSDSTGYYGSGSSGYYGSGSSGYYGSTGDYAYIDQSEFGSRHNDVNACLSGLDCADLPEARR